jgi:hypothetical protein
MLPLALTLAPEMSAMVMILQPVMLPVADIKPGVVTLPPAILLVTFKLLTTFELKLNPAAFKLPATTLLDALSVVAEITLAPVILPLAPEVEMLPATILPLALTLPVLTLPDTTLPVALTSTVLTLPLFTLPVAEIKPGVVKLAPAMSPVTFNALITFELRLNPAAFKLPATTFPVALTSTVLTLPLFTLPVADIKPGVVMFEPAMLPDTLKLLTTFELKLKPAPFMLLPSMLPDALTVVP